MAGSPLYPDLENQCVLITGGATGIGEALVRAFAVQKAVVFFCDIQEEAGTTLARELGEHVVFNRVDLTQEADIIEWIQEVVDQHPTIKVLINNAAEDRRLPLAETSTEAWEQLLRINLRAAYLCIREASPHMKNANASIINLGSVTFQLGEGGLSAYVTAKGGIVGMTRSLARELGRDHIRVNALSPGWVMTDKQLRLYVDDETKAMLYRDQCIPTLLQPNDMAEIALFLASGVSRAITGQNIEADGGWRHL